MKLLPTIAAVALLLLVPALYSPAQAQNVVRCESIKNRYNECDAPWGTAKLVEQTSRAPCVVGNTWGFNATTRRLWVSQGCRGVFTYGAKPRSSNNGHTETAATDAVLAAVIAEEERKERERVRREREAAAYDGCHGIGCYVDNPDAPVGGYADPGSEPMPESNFDANGDYNGCHGVGCYITNPDAP